MHSYIIGGLAMAALCAGWVLVQRWIADRAPDVKGPESGCHGCGGCTGACERPEPEPDPSLPTAQARPH